MAISHVSKEDIIIAVMGATGAGKSTFIRLLTGQDVVIGHRLRSCTKDVLPIACQHPQKQGQRVVFLDTPGFDDTNKTDVEILENIAKWLAQSYVQGIKLSGVLYLHRISDNRMSGMSMKCLKLFRDLCGEKTFVNVVLVTTMWSRVEETVGSDREQQLKTEYWMPLIAGGAQVARFSDTLDNGWSIISLLKDKQKIVTSIQHEMIDQRKELVQTTAGVAVAQSLAALTARHREEIRALEEEHKLALKSRDDAMRDALDKERKKFERLLQEADATLEELKKPKGWLTDLFNGILCVLTLGIFPTVFG